ncbi:MAG TPA: hypothetical protein VFH51_13040 [Myxococcota bacterium]|nr:hypothetical protein [Myxococcota bacterium]
MSLRPLAVASLLSVLACRATLTVITLDALRLTPTQSTVAVGQGVSVTLTALTPQQATYTDYRGTVSLVSSDPGATLPASHTFTALDGGVTTFSVTFASAGVHTVTVTDPTRNESGSTTFTVTAAKHCVELGTPLSLTAGPGMTQDAPVKDLALTDTDRPVLAYAAPSGGSSTYVYARRFNGSAWAPYGANELVSSVASPAVSPVLQLTSLDHPVVAWASGNPTPGVAGNSTVFLAQWDGLTWVSKGTSNNAAGVSGAVPSVTDPLVALALEPTGAPWVAWDHDTPYEVLLRGFNGSSWVAVGGTELLKADAFRPSLAMPTANNHAVLAWTDNGDAGNYKILAGHFDGVAWSLIGGTGEISASGPVNGDHASVALEADGTPVVAWDAYASPSTNILDVYVRRWKGTAWEELAGSGTGRGVSQSTAGAQRPSLHADPLGNILLAWEDLASHQIYLRAFDGYAWQDLGGSASGSGISQGASSSAWPKVLSTHDAAPVVAWEEKTGASYTLHVCAWQ